MGLTRMPPARLYRTSHGAAGISLGNSQVYGDTVLLDGTNAERTDQDEICVGQGYVPDPCHCLKVS